jgi:hypothetical protein
MVRWSLPFAFYACIVRRQLGARNACPAPACFPRNGETLESANPFLAELGQLPRRIRTEEIRLDPVENAAEKSTKPALCL